MAARTLAYRTGLFTLLQEILYSHSQMSEEPLAAPQIVIFQALRDEWKLILHEEIEILGELSRGQAAVDRADNGVDSFSGRVSRAIDDNTNGQTRKQIRGAVFKNRTLSRFRRRVLGRQLLDMADWPDILEKCGVPALAALAPEAAALVAAGKKAESMRNEAKKKNRVFRDTGARKQFIDKVNAARKESHGALATLPFQHPNLPQDFADMFFMMEPPREEEETIDQVKASIEELEANLEKRRALLKKLEDDAALEAKAAQERAALEASADDLEAQAKALLAQAAMLKAKLSK